MNRRLLLTASLCALVLPACGGGASGASSEALQIAVVPKGTTHEFWKSVHAGAKAAARDLGVEIIWKGPIREDDRDEQIQIVENFVVRGVDGVVLMPMDRKALVTPAEEAAGQGIPVVVADSDLDWEGRTSFVATDNRRGGELAAEALAEMMGGEGDVVMLRYQEGSASTFEREEGFLEAIGRFDAINVISSNQYAGATNEGAYQASENLLNSFEAVDGIFCPNESAAFGMLRALQDAGRTDAVSFVGFDASDKLVEALRAGEIDALVLQDPVRMGDLAVRACVSAVRGEPVEARIDTGVVVVPSSKIDDPSVQALLQPDLSILDE